MFNNPVLGQHCEAIEYHRIIKEAKIDYNNKKYKEASKKIKEAFSKKIIPFGEDLDFALKMAIKTNNNEWAKEIAIVLAKGGVPIKYFLKLKKFTWYNEFIINFKNYSDFYQIKCDSSFESNMISLIEKDKKFTYKYHGWRLKKTEMSLEEMTEKAVNIFDLFCSIIDKYGFPSSENVGYYYNKGKDRVESYNTEILLIHIYQRGELIFNDELEKLFCFGNIDINTHNALIEVSRQFENNSPGVRVEMKRRYDYFNK